MAYDGLVLRAVTLELEKALIGARIDKVYQPSKSEIILVLRQPGHTYKLLLSALAQESGAYLTSQQIPNPQEPPLFCMVLRKHLEGGRIKEISQQGLERVMKITCEITDELGDRVSRAIIVEIMGKHSNIILLDPLSDKVLDSAQRVSLHMSRYRQILPGLTYQSPPPQDKIVPWEADHDSFHKILLKQPLSQKISKVLLNSFSGLSPQSAEEIILRTGLDPGMPLEFCGEYELGVIWRTFSQISSSSRDGIFQPEVIVKDRVPVAFSALALTQYPPEMRLAYSSMNEALDYYFSRKRSSNVFEQKKADLNQVIKRETDRCEKKSGIQEQTVLEAVEADKFRLWGELLTAGQYQLQQGKEALVTNYYDPEEKAINIPLEEELSIQKNAQRYFKKYQKAKQAAQQAGLQLQETRNELEYLLSMSASLENVTTLTELEEIKDELREAGYIKALPVKSKRKPKEREASSLECVLQDGWEIYYGKNNRQNDFLTTKIAKADDIWLHTKNIPGSHVVIKNPGGNTVPDHVLETAAILSAYHSKARFSTNVPVDYTYKKHVWKLKGAKPGMVHYENQQTIYITPSEDRLKALLKK